VWGGLDGKSGGSERSSAGDSTLGGVRFRKK
jgi:hypothetical protein